MDFYKKLFGAEPELPEPVERCWACGEPYEDSAIEGYCAHCGRAVDDPVREARDRLFDALAPRVEREARERVESRWAWGGLVMYIGLLALLFLAS